MAYIFQTFRVELDAAIKKNAHLLHGKILDVGAGAVDRYSRYFDATAYIRMNLKPDTGTQLVGSIEAIPATEGEFDGIVCTQVLGDIYNLQKAMDELSRVLKVGGRVLLTESFIDPLHDEPHDYWRFTPHSLKRLLTDAGFTVVAFDRVGGYHSTMAQLRTRYRIQKYHLYSAWYGRVASAVFKFWGVLALQRDAYNLSDTSKLFAQGWLIVAEKSK